MSKKMDAYEVREVVEQAQEFVCEKTDAVIESYGRPLSDAGELFCMIQDLQSHAKINEALEKCKSVKAVQKELLKHYSKKEVKEAIGNLLVDLRKDF